jgi:hypothetical protein
MQGELREKRRITPQKAIAILEQHGTKINMDEAEIILDFMYKMSKLTVENFLKKKSRKAI